MPAPEPDMPEDAMPLGFIVISKFLTGDDIGMSVCAEDGAGNTIALIDVLGMLEFSKMQLIEDYIRDGDPEDESDG